MRRRELLAGLGALGVVGTGAAYQFGGLDDRLRGGGSRVESRELERIDAPGSSPGTEVVPEPGRVTYVDFFATWCSICQRKMEPMGEAARAVDSEVQFLSVTNEPLGVTTTRTDVVEWWEEHDGNWPVAHDESLELSRAVNASGVPYAAVIDADNRLVWSDAGYKNASEILDPIREARDVSPE